MQTELTFNPSDFGEKICRLILDRAERWKCPPSTALSRILDELADKSGFTVRKSRPEPLNK